MRPYSTFLGLPASLLVLVVSQAASSEAPPPAQARPPQLPTAIRKMGLDGGEKFFPEYMAFAVGAPDAVFEYAPTPLSPREAALAARLARRDADADANANGDPLPAGNASLPLRPAFATHGGLEEDQSSPLELLRRAAEALHLLQGRQSCPAGMGSCAAIGAPNKCCITGEYCVQVNDPSVGQVACCPQGRTCSGSVGPCGAGSTSCSADLGGGCCIPGYVCQGVGCELRSFERDGMDIGRLTMTPRCTKCLCDAYQDYNNDLDYSSSNVDDNNAVHHDHDDHPNHHRVRYRRHTAFQANNEHLLAARNHASPNRNRLSNGLLRVPGPV